MAHGRLDILFNKIGKKEKSKYHLNHALSFSNTFSERMKIQTENNLIALLQLMDESQKTTKNKVEHNMEMDAE